MIDELRVRKEIIRLNRLRPWGNSHASFSFTIPVDEPTSRGWREESAILKVEQFTIHPFNIMVRDPNLPGLVNHTFYARNVDEARYVAEIIMDLWRGHADQQ